MVNQMFGTFGVYAVDDLLSISKIEGYFFFFQKCALICFYTKNLEDQYFSATEKQLYLLEEYIKQGPLKRLKRTLIIKYANTGKNYKIIDLDYVKKVPRELA